MTPHEICEAIGREDGTPYYVGGSVRDELMGMTPKDYDVEVFDIRPAKLKRILERFGVVSEVGESFGVMKLRLPNGEIDFSTPRRENKIGRGHRGFQAELDNTMSVAEAASRRDFTINAIYKNALTGEILDYFGGEWDLKFRVLRHVDAAHFGEDPLRVLRGMQFASRFNLTPENKTTILCYELLQEYDTLAVERIGDEWRKWAVGNHPSRGIQFLVETAWYSKYPAIFDMLGVSQNPVHHPEGSVLAHTGFVCDAMANICQREEITGEDREVLMLAALTHDMGKPSTTFTGLDGGIRSPGHAEAGVPIAHQFLKSIGIFDRVIARVIPLVKEHMWATWEKQTLRTVRRLKVRLQPATFDELMLLVEADRSGRPPIPPSKPENYEHLMSLAANLPPKIEPILTGRDLIDLGFTVGPVIGKLKKLAFEAQLEEEFTDKEGAKQWIINYIEKERNACSTM